MKKLIFAVCSLVLVMGLLSGCHTVAGAGEDISETGQTITHVAS